MRETTTSKRKWNKAAKENKEYIVTKAQNMTQNHNAGSVKFMFKGDEYQIERSLSSLVSLRHISHLACFGSERKGWPNGCLRK